MLIFRGFWAHAEFAAQLMNHVANAIGNNSIGPTEIQALLHSLAHRHLSIRTWKQLSVGFATTITCENQEKMPLTSILFYIMEGFLPMITMFCKQLVEANRADINSKLIRELLTTEPISVLKAVGDGVMVSESLLTQLEQHYATPTACISHSSFTLFLALAMVSDWSVNGYAAVAF